MELANVHGIYMKMDFVKMYQSGWNETNLKYYVLMIQIGG